MNNPPIDSPTDNPGAPIHSSDEELSAFVDGALDTDSNDRVVAHVASCSQCSQRRVELAKTAGLVRSATVDPVDELTRRRLIDQAMDASEATPASRRSGQWFGHPATAAVAAVAAAVFVVVGFISFDGTRDSGSSAKSAGDSLAVAEAAAQGHFLGDIGEIGDPKRLRSAIDDAATGEDQATDEMGPGEEPAGGSTSIAGSATPFAAPASELPAASEVPSDAQPDRRSDSAPTGSDREAVGHCAQVTQLSLDATADEGEGAFRSTLTFSAIGTYKNAAAVILVYTTPSGGQQIFVVARDDCTILSFQGSRAAP